MRNFEAAQTAGLVIIKSKLAALLASNNPQIESPFTWLKLVKQQMYGRANLDLLRTSLSDSMAQSPYEKVMQSSIRTPSFDPPVNVTRLALRLKRNP